MFNLLLKKKILLISPLALNETFFIICKIWNKQNVKRGKTNKRPKDFSSDYRNILDQISKNPLIRIVQFEFGIESGLRNTIENMKNYNLNISDSFHSAMMQDQKSQTIVSNDSDFDRISDIKRINF